MKFILALLIVLSVQYSFSQNNTGQEKVYFAQAMFNLETEAEMLMIQQKIRQNPFIQMVRLDYSTNKVFIVTNKLESFTEANLRALFLEYSDRIGCVQIGVFGVDDMLAYPINCNK